MSTYEAFKGSKSLEQDGIRLELGEAGTFQLARAGGANKRYQKRFEFLLKPHRRSIQTDTMDNEKAEEILAQVYAETVVLNWEDVTGEDGKGLAFSIEACKKLLSDLPELFIAIRETAQNAALYREMILEEDSGN